MLIKYDYNNYKQHIDLTYIDKNSKVQNLKIKLKPEDIFNWYYCKSGEQSDGIAWDMRPLKKYYEEINIWEKDRNDLNRVIELMYENLSDEQVNEIFETEFETIYSIDIETEMLDNDSNKPNNPLAKIQTISIVSNKENVMVLGLKELLQEQIDEIRTQLNDYFKDYHCDFKVTYRQFEDEAELLRFYVTKMMPKMAIQTGWFFNGFDLPYILARCERNGIETEKITGKLHRTNPPNLMQNMGDMTYFLPTKFLSIDYMELCFLYERSVNMKISKKLDYVADEILGLGKIQMPEGFMEMYNNNFQKYIYYNIVDAALVMLIDRYSKCFLTHLGKMNTCKCTVYDAFKDTKMLLHVLIFNFLKEGKHLTNQKYMMRRDNESRDFIGGWVFQGKQRFEKYCTSFDFSSLYPNCVFQWNISPDSLIYNKERS